MSTIHNEGARVRGRLEKEFRETVSVALFGQPGAGKSSLINKMVGEKVAEVGVETDKTTKAGWYKARGLNFCDLPGYGTTRFPKDTYIERFEIKKFDLFLCVTSGKLHQADSEFFNELKRLNKVCIFVVNKRDELWEEGVELEELESRKVKDIQKHVGTNVTVLFTSCKDNFGLDALNAEISNNLDAAKQERWDRNAKAYSEENLERKKKAAEAHVFKASLVAALNGLNPIPGVNVAVDVSMMLKLFRDLREDYGLDDDYLEMLVESSIPNISHLASDVFNYGTKNGLFVLLNKYAGTQASRLATRYIPFIGPLLSGAVGYGITSNAGKKYLDYCHDLAESAFKESVKR